MNQRTLKILAGLVVAVVAVAAVVVFLAMSNNDKVILKVYTAGSLSEPFSSMEDGTDLKTLFEREHPNVEVQVTSGGSADMIRRVTGLNQICDVLAVADSSLIPSMMINATPATADFCIEFARNSMIIAYTNQSAHHDELNQDNWYDILRMPGVRFGFSNPNDDPAGYRSQMVMLLAETYYSDSLIYEDLVLNNTNIIGVSFDSANGTYTINVPSTLNVNNADKVMVRSAEVDLTSALEAGSIDYLFIYESVSIRHASSGERYLELPRQINLNDTAYASQYSKVRVKQFADSTDPNKTKVVKGGPIVYGVTIPKNSLHPDLAIEFVKMLVGADGQEVMENAGQEPITPAHAGYWREQVPTEIRDIVD